MGLTQTELARHAGVSQNLISAIEERRRNFAMPSRSRILNALADVEWQQSIIAKRAMILAIEAYFNLG